MKKIDLLQSEKVIEIAKLPVWFWIRFGLELLIILFPLHLIPYFGSIDYYDGLSSRPFRSVIGIGLFRIIIIIALLFQLPYLTSILAVTDRRVYMRKGLLSKTVVEFHYDKIESVEVYQSLFGRLFNYGMITISGVGSKSKDYPYVSNPVKFRESLYKQMELERPKQLSSSTNDKMPCPYCGEMISKDAKKCRFCGEWLHEK